MLSQPIEVLKHPKLPPVQWSAQSGYFKPELKEETRKAWTVIKQPVKGGALPTVEGQKVVLARRAARAAAIEAGGGVSGAVRPQHEDEALYSGGDAEEEYEVEEEGGEEYYVEGEAGGVEEEAEMEMVPRRGKKAEMTDRREKLLSMLEADLKRIEKEEERDFDEGKGRVVVKEEMEEEEYEEVEGYYYEEAEEAAGPVVDLDEEEEAARQRALGKKR